MEKRALQKELEKLAFNLGAALFGVAHVKSIKKEFHFSAETLKGLDYAISIGLRLSDTILEGIKEEPTKVYYHHYRTVNTVLDGIALRVSNFIQSRGYKALPVPASQIIDWERQRGHLIR